MKFFIQNIKVNVHQIFFSPLYLISILGTTILVALVMQSYVGIDGNSVTYLLDLSMPKKIVVILAAIPYSASFCTDWNHQYIQPMISRTGIKSYIFAKFFVNFLFSFSVTFIGLLIAVGIYSFQFPLINYEYQDIGSFSPYQSLITNSSPFIYILMKSAVFSLASGTWSAAGMMFSSFIPNYFVTITSTIVFSYIIEEFTTLFPRPFNLYVVTSSQGDYGGATRSFLFFMGIFFLYTLTFGLIFRFQVNRRLLNETV